MNLSEYQEEASKTTRFPADVPPLFYNAAGMCDEAGEVLEAYLNGYTSEGDGIIDPKQVKKELGDVLWYTAMAARQLEYDLGSLAANADELRGELPECIGNEVGPLFAASVLCKQTADTMGAVKKLFRDQSVLDFHAKSALLARIEDGLTLTLAAISLVAEDNHLTLDEIAAGNLEKVLARREKGTIHGTGDNR